MLKYKIFLICLIVLTNQFSLESLKKDLMNSQKFLNEEVIDTKLLNLIEIISSAISNSTKESQSFICNTCKSFFSYAMNSDKFIQRTVLKFIGTEVCVIAKLFTKDVCAGAVEEMIPHIINSFNKHFLNPDFACPLIKLCPKSYQKIDIEAYKNDILKDKPSNAEEIPTKKRILKVLHISDLHTDLEYKEGSDAVCDHPICCRAESVFNAKVNKAREKAGKWGSVAMCDLPSRTLNQFIEYIKTHFQIDFALWTGDNTSHDIWQQSYERNLENTKVITNLFKNSLNFTFFPVIGNHESFPVNVYDFNSDREKIFNKNYADLWKDWIGNDAFNTYSNFSYYSSYKKEMNLKVIGLNSQACNDENWYLLQDPTDPGGMLKWLRNELNHSETRNHSVYIIQHIPNNDCLDTFSQIYNALVDRYSHIIKGQFAGHTHGDTYTTNKDLKNKTNNIMFIAPSLTTYGIRNPEFRIYEIDFDTMRPVNYQQYRLNLTKWNALPNDNVEWDLAYDFLSEYNYSDMSFKTFENLTERLRTNSSTIELFKYHDKSGLEAMKNNNSNLDLSYYCSTFAVNSERAKCNGQKESFKDKLLAFISGPWKEKINK